MSKYSFELPSDFSEYEWVVDAKGWCSGSRLVVAGKRYPLTFYDPVRLSQEIENKLEDGDFFFEPNLVIVKQVTRANMERAVDELVQSGQVGLLTPE